MVRDSFRSRLVAEFLVIALGVLVAWAADRWNQGRADSAVEAIYMARFTDDIRADSLRAEEYLSRFPSTMAARDSLLDFVDGSVVPPDLILTVQRAFPRMTLVPPATWNEILSTSSLAILRDRESREAISYYYQTDRALLEQNLERADRRGRDPFVDVLYPIGIFEPCLEDTNCRSLPMPEIGVADFVADFRPVDAEVFRSWPGIRALLVGLGSGHGAQRLFAEGVLRTTGNALRAVEGPGR